MQFDGRLGFSGGFVGKIGISIIRNCIDKIII